MITIIVRSLYFLGGSIFYFVNLLVTKDSKIALFLVEERRNDKDCLKEICAGIVIKAGYLRNVRASLAEFKRNLSKPIDNKYVCIDLALAYNLKLNMRRSF